MPWSAWAPGRGQRSSAGVPFRQGIRARIARRTDAGEGKGLTAVPGPHPMAACRTRAARKGPGKPRPDRIRRPARRAAPARRAQGGARVPPPPPPCGACHGLRKPLRRGIASPSPRRAPQCRISGCGRWARPQCVSGEPPCDARRLWALGALGPAQRTGHDCAPVGPGAAIHGRRAQRLDRTGWARRHRVLLCRCWRRAETGSCVGGHGFMPSRRLWLG
jgi:hypothetical protein